VIDVADLVAAMRFELRRSCGLCPWADSADPFEVEAGRIWLAAAILSGQRI
jgi:hypothetical protein